MEKKTIEQLTEETIENLKEKVKGCEDSITNYHHYLEFQKQLVSLRDSEIRILKSVISRLKQGLV